MASGAPSRTLAVATVVFALALVTGTGAYDAVDAGRHAAVPVASDATGALGLETPSIALANGPHDAVPVLVVTNRFPGPLTTVTATVTDAGPGAPRLDAGPAPAALRSGASVTLSAAVVCGGRHTETWPVQITATGPGTRITLTRSVTVTCTGAPGPKQPESGDAAITDGPATTVVGAPTGTAEPDRSTETAGSTTSQGGPA